MPYLVGLQGDRSRLRDKVENWTNEDLTLQDVLLRHVQALQGHFDFDAILFGSRARGEAIPFESDVDVLILCDEKDRNSLKRCLYENMSDRPWPVISTIVKSKRALRLNPSLEMNIKKDGIRVMDEITRVTLARNLIDKSERAFMSANINFGNGQFETATGRYYYACFYLIDAMMIILDQEYGKHKQTLGNWNREWVYRRKMFQGMDIYHDIASLFDNREDADYSRDNIDYAELAENSRLIAMRVYPELLGVLQQTIRRMENGEII